MVTKKTHVSGNGLYIDASDHGMDELRAAIHKAKDSIDEYNDVIIVLNDKHYKMSFEEFKKRIIS